MHFETANTMCVGVLRMLRMACYWQCGGEAHVVLQTAVVCMLRFIGGGAAAAARGGAVVCTSSAAASVLGSNVGACHIH